MIKLLSILKEIASKPKAIFLAGSAGSGKTYIIKQFPSLNKFNIINVDDKYEELLKASGLSMSHKDFGPEELSKAAKLMGQARSSTREKYTQYTQEKQNIVIDSTGGAIKPILNKKRELEELGYETMMLMIYVSPVTSLERNVSRERALLPQVVLRTWRDANKNIDGYREAFGDKFILINNNSKDAEINYNPKDIKKRFFDTAKFKGKDKTPDEQDKALSDKEQLNNDINQLIKQLPQFNTMEDAKSTLNAFIQ